MFLYVTKDFRASVAGSRTVAVECEKCGTRFEYELSRVGSGVAAAHYYTFQAWAARRAGHRAERDLARRLSREADLEPCPRCGWVNEESIRRARRQRYRVPPIWAAAFVAVAGLFVFALYLNDIPLPKAVGTVLAYSLPPIAIALLLRHIVRRRIDPNAEWRRQAGV